MQSCESVIPVYLYDPNVYRVDDLQKPVDGDEQADVLSGQPNRCENQQHGHQSGTGDTGSSNTG